MVDTDETIKAITLPDTLTVNELADELGLSAIEIIKELMKNGVMATINQVIDFDTAAIVLADLGFEAIEKDKESIDDSIDDEDQKKQDVFESLRYNLADKENAEPRSPIVTVLGHVDHGKTTLLDKIRTTNVASGEAGNITQSVAAYQAQSPDKRSITFIDTPGHAAFTNMRKRGAQITDVAIVVIAADDGVMPQTKEVIEFIKSADIPMIAAINKIDLNDVSIDRVKQQLMEIGLTPEEYGGDLVVSNISAISGEGIDELLETTQLIADLQELKARPEDQAEGIILEAKIDKKKGITATVIVQNGTLHKSEIISTETTYGKIRSMNNEYNKSINEAGPSVPVIITGLADMPIPGEKFRVQKNEKEAKKIIESAKRQNKRDSLKSATIAAELISSGKNEDEGTKYLNLIIKSDTQGTMEPILNTLDTFNSEDISINVIDASIGSINEADINLASISESAVLGFNTYTETGAEKLADQENVSISSFTIIYDLREAVESLINETLGPIITIEEVGKVEIKKIFKIDKTEMIAGSYVIEGKITKGDHVRVIRDEEILAESIIANIKRESDDVNEVNAGAECGIKLSSFNNFEENDQLIAFHINEEKRTI